MTKIPKHLNTPPGWSHRAWSRRLLWLGECCIHPKQAADFRTAGAAIKAKADAVLAKPPSGMRAHLIAIGQLLPNGQRMGARR